MFTMIIIIIIIIIINMNIIINILTNRIITKVSLIAINIIFILISVGYDCYLADSSCLVTLNARLDAYKCCGHWSRVVFCNVPTIYLPRVRKLILITLYVGCSVHCFLEANLLSASYRDCRQIQSSN